VGASLGPLSLVSVTSSVRNLTASYEANILPLVSAVVAPTNLDTGLAKQSSAKSQLKLAKHGGKLTSKLAGSSFGVVDAYFADLGGRVAAA
jgi:hypothetical protein